MALRTVVIFGCFGGALFVLYRREECTNYLLPEIIIAEMIIVTVMIVVGDVRRVREARGPVYTYPTRDDVLYRPVLCNDRARL